jgi:hypothetical protein
VKEECSDEPSDVVLVGYNAAMPMPEVVPHRYRLKEEIVQCHKACAQKGSTIGIAESTGE